MAQTTIEQFATELKMPTGALIEQLAAAGMGGLNIGDRITEQDKTRLLDYLRKQHGALSEPKKRITLTRKQTTEIKAGRLVLLGRAEMGGGGGGGDRGAAPMPESGGDEGAPPSEEDIPF